MVGKMPNVTWLKGSFVETEIECLHCKGNGHWKRKCPEYLVDKKDGKVNKGLFDIHVIDVCLTSVYSSP